MTTEQTRLLRLQKRNRNRQFVYDYLIQHPCLICGEKDPVVLEFDHVDPSQKHKAISELVLKEYALSTITKEILKCQVLCANCHRRKTHKQNGHWTPGTTTRHTANTTHPLSL